MGLTSPETDARMVRCRPPFPPIGSRSPALTSPIRTARQHLRVLDAIDRVEAGRGASEDLDALRAWDGWGPMAPVLGPEVTGTLARLSDEITDRHPPAELREALVATSTAFYTDPTIALSMWRMAEALGFTGGRVLEPGCGNGRFMDAVPASLDVRFTGVERDPFTARLAQALHPEAEIITGDLQEVALRDDFFDLAIANVPFSDVRCRNHQMASRHPIPAGLALHNYFLMRGLAACRPGGLVVAITSRYTLDAGGGSIRSFGRSGVAREGYRHDLEALGEFLGAIRLPTGAHRDAGTEVVTDIVVFRRRPGHIPAPDPTPTADGPDALWWEVDNISGPADERGRGARTTINRYFTHNPHMVVGDLDVQAGQYYQGDLRVLCPPGQFFRRMADAVDDLVACAAANDRLVTPRPQEQALVVAPIGVDLGVVGGESREGRFVVGGDGRVYVVQGGRALVVSKPGRELRALIELRDAGLSLLELESNPDTPDSLLDPQRSAARALYEAYVAKFGPLNRATVRIGAPDPETGIATVVRSRPRLGGFRSDPDCLTVLALEVFDDSTDTVHPAPILCGRINARPVRPDQVETPAEAVAVSVDVHGEVRLPTVARLLDLGSEDEAAAALRASRAAFEDPLAPGRWSPAWEYLSGQVRRKHEQAVDAGERDAVRWSGNIESLAAVIPEDLSPEEIKVRLGSPWVPPADVAGFCSEVLQQQVVISHDPVTGSWEIENLHRSRYIAPDILAAYGTTHFTPLRLVDIALNGRTPVAEDEEIGPTGRKRKVRNIDATLVAIEVTQRLNEAFAEWLWDEPERCGRLVRLYNDRFNATVAPLYDGSALTFPGMASAFTPYRHQLDMVARILGSHRSACGFAPGAGKTEAIAMSARKLRELGLAKKPAVVVPNHLVEQFAVQVKTVFPLARVLAASKEDFSPERRRHLVAKVATGDWDLVVLPLTGFGMIPLSPRAEAEYLESVIHEMRQAMTRARVHAKAAGKALMRLENRRRDLLAARRDDQITFEQTGIDFLHIDEAHLFKNKAVATRLAGFSMPASQRAEDLAAKLGYLGQRNVGRHVTTLWSGTLLSNTLLEIFVMQSYCQPQVLAEVGLSSFDAWAAQFVHWQSAVEVAPDGATFRLQQRPVLVNVPELRSVLLRFLDYRDEEQLGLKRPAREDHNIAVDPTPEQRAYVAGLVDRAEKVRTLRVTDDNMLVIVGDGRKVALDPRLVDLPASNQSKLAVASRQIAALYHETREVPVVVNDAPTFQPGVQLVFCDLGTPHPGDEGAYGWVRDQLVAHGVPRSAVAFIHGAKTDATRSALIRDVRHGKISVLIGSTEKLGVGTNVQDLVTDMHHLDAPWRPSDVQQRDGRGWRPGNLIGRIRVWRYVTTGSFDAYMWQKLEQKMAWISVVLRGNSSERVVEDIDSVVISYAQMKALATGQPILMELAEAEAEAARLGRLATAHRRMMARLSFEGASLRRNASHADEAAREWYRVARDWTKGQDSPDPYGRYGGTVSEKVVAVMRAVASEGRSASFLLDGVFVRAEPWTTARGKPAVSVTTGGIRGVDVAFFTVYELGHRSAADVVGVLRQALAGAPEHAAELDRRAARLRAEAEENERAAGPFAHSGDLIAAEARVLALRAQVDATVAQPPDPGDDLEDEAAA